MVGTTLAYTAVSFVLWSLPLDQLTLLLISLPAGALMLLWQFWLVQRE
jgi:hypothetical protein